MPRVRVVREAVDGGGAAGEAVRHVRERRASRDEELLGGGEQPQVEHRGVELRPRLALHADGVAVPLDAHAVAAEPPAKSSRVRRAIVARKSTEAFARAAGSARSRASPAPRRVVERRARVDADDARRRGRGPRAHVRRRVEQPLLRAEEHADAGPLRPPLPPIAASGRAWWALRRRSGRKYWLEKMRQMRAAVAPQVGAHRSSKPDESSCAAQVSTDSPRACSAATCGAQLRSRAGARASARRGRRRRRPVLDLQHAADHAAAAADTNDSMMLPRPGTGRVSSGRRASPRPSAAPARPISRRTRGARAAATIGQAPALVPHAAHAARLVHGELVAGPQQEARVGGGGAPLDAPMRGAATATLEVAAEAVFHADERAARLPGRRTTAGRPGRLEGDANNSARRGGGARGALFTEVLPADALGLVLYQLTLAHDGCSGADVAVLWRRL